jgi:hypothetical protein
MFRYSNISAVSEMSSNENEIRPYLNTFEGFNVLDIRPLTKNGRPLVAGINGYNLSNIDANEYRNKKIAESFDNFVEGIKHIGATYEYLFGNAAKDLKYLINDYKTMKTTKQGTEWWFLMNLSISLVDITSINTDSSTIQFYYNECRLLLNMYTTARDPIYLIPLRSKRTWCLTKMFLCFLYSP